MNTNQQLVLALLRDKAPETDVARLNALSESGWRDVVQLAESMGLGPLLFRNARRLQVRLPKAVDDLMLESLRNNTARNLRILQEFKILADALQKQGIAFMPLKGIYLCSNLYENPGERALWDIDLIVPLGEMRRALAAIESTGYRASRPYDLDLEIKLHQHVPAYIKAGAPPLEVHWTLLEPRFEKGLAWQDLWARSVPARVGEATAQVLSPADLVIYLCAHVAYHHTYAGSVRSLYDIKLVVQRFAAELDWDLIASRARACALINSLYLSLRLTKDLLGCGLGRIDVAGPLPIRLQSRARPGGAFPRFRTDGDFAGDQRRLGPTRFHPADQGLVGPNRTAAFRAGAHLPPATEVQTALLLLFCTPEGYAHHVRGRFVRFVPGAPPEEGSGPPRRGIDGLSQVVGVGMG